MKQLIQLLSVVVVCLMFATPAFAQPQTTEAESMTPSSSVGAVTNDTSASGGKFYRLWSTSYIPKTYRYQETWTG